MIFNSFAFLIFFLIFYILYVSLKDRRYRIVLCLVGSYFFYGWWDWRFLSLIIFSTLVDFLVGKALHTESDDSRRKKWLLVSLFSNLGLLFFFKYFNFFVDSFVEVATTLGMSPSVTALNIILPVGISFYTFQTLSYTIDIYWRRMEPEPNLIVFATYVAFFPQLVAGPIIRAIDLLPQFRDQNKVTFEMAISGLMLVLVGYFKKVVLADSLAPLVDNGFANPYIYTSLNLCIIVVFYAFQIYCDFSGYSDIAIGIGKMFGFHFPRNFNLPYIAQNFSDFWKRWHISLSGWLRDYLYIPLGGNRGSSVLTQRNLMLTMLLGGLWHGANWTFIIWGGLHGGYLVAQRILQPVAVRLRGVLHKSIYTIFSILMTFFLVNLAWVFFRSQSMSQAFDLLAYIYNNGDYSFSNVKLKFQVIEGMLLIFMLYFGELIYTTKPKVRELFSYNNYYKLGFASFILWLILFFGTFENNNFIYFQF